METLTAVRARHIPIDRDYYLKSLRVPMDNIFQPIVCQRIALADPTMSEAEVRAKGAQETRAMLWNIILGRRLTQTKAKQQACLAVSPIAMAFARQAGAAAVSSTKRKKAAGDDNDGDADCRQEEEKAAGAAARR